MPRVTCGPTAQKHLPATSIRSWIAGLALVSVALLATGCSGTAISSTGAPAASSVTSEPASGSSGAAACIDAETAAIIRSIRDTPTNAQAIITEKRDALIAGLQRFTPPADATTWRDELVTAVQNGDIAAAQAKLQAIGSQVTVAFC